MRTRAFLNLLRKGRYFFMYMSKVFNLQQCEGFSSTRISLYICKFHDDIVLYFYGFCHIFYLLLVVFFIVEFILTFTGTH